MKIKKKGEVGIARIFVSQKQAQKKLQLSLKDFRRLCILKGIYPREPSHIKKANKGSSESKIFYHLRDINFLSSEPLIKKFREYKVFLRRISHAKAKRENEKAQSLIDNKPVFRLDHLIKERYPTFTSALQDLDDALCLCFAFTALTQSKTARPQTIIECRRLTAEFMHYVIESQALSKVFVSIKGIYYQAEIMGEKVTWIVGHDRAVGRANEMDFSVMATFVDFYVSMLSFVNFRLYKSLGLHYPPKLQKSLTSADMDDFANSDEVSEKIYSLAVPLDREPMSESEVVIDSFDDSDSTGTFAEKLQRAQTLKQLFSKFKFFLNREVPKEALAFLIRSCGGTVSWDGCPISLYNDKSSLITHQIVDRPIQNYNINRVYIQPQWVFDCFNARELLPASKYAPGEMLPPHLSPFGENNVRECIEEEIEKNLKENLNEAKKQNGDATGKAKKKFEAKTTKGAGMQVKVGQAYKENKQKEINQKGHNLKLREMMIAKKHRRVYKKIKFGMKREAKEKNKLQEKRARLEQTE